MAIKLPAPVPQVPVSDLDRAISFYRSHLGFALDWKHENGIAGVSSGEARIFLDRVTEGPVHPIRIWLNLSSISEVDALCDQWKRAGVVISSPPERKPWGLYEFTALDCDENSFRVFYDFVTPEKEACRTEG